MARQRNDKRDQTVVKKLTFLMAFLVLLGSSISTYGQDLDSLPSTQNSVKEVNSLDELAQEEEFLPVDEAYQLEAKVNEDSLSFSWVIADAYYMYGDNFKVVVDGTPVEFSKPDGKIAYDAIFEEDLEKHRTFVELTVAKDQFTEGQPSKIAVHSQGCADGGLCYPPQVRNFVLSPNQASIMTVAAVDRFANPEAAEAVVEEKTTEPASFKTALNMILLALAGGVILNLMPCVLPVLSLKALSLTSGHNLKEQKQHGWSYTLGVMTTFVTIAAVLLAVRAGGQAVGWGFQLQTPWFVTALILLFLVMGLSLSGLVEFGGKWMGMGQNLTSGTSLQSSYFTGVLASVVASPCTAPFMATALGFALAQPALIALSIFAALGLGMALPFLLLSYVPKLGEYLPKPGAWMETFKQALAFPLYLTALWLLWVLGRQLGSSSMAGIAIAGLGIIFIYWLSVHSKTIRPFGHVLALLVVGYASWNISQVTPPENGGLSESSVWESYSPERLKELRQAGEPVFVNMTADWCITCKANEKRVFTEERLQDMKDKGITLIQGDWTNYNPEITKLLEEYGRGGVPLYVLFPSGTDGEAKVLPQILSPSKFEAEYSAL